MTAVIYAGVQDGTSLVERIRASGVRTIVWITPDSEDAAHQHVEQTVNNADCVIVKSADNTSVCQRLLDAALTRRVPVFREECVDRIQCMHSFYH